MDDSVTASNTLDGDNLFDDIDNLDELEDIDEPPRLSQQQILSLVTDIVADDAEDTLAFAARLGDVLANKSTATQELSLKNAKRPREYRAKKLSGDTLQYLQRAHVSYRVAFGLYMNQDPILAVIKKVFKDFPGNADVKENAERIAWERLRNVCASWKLKTINRMEDHIKEICSQNEIFANCRDLHTLQSILKNTFDTDNWAEIMEPWRKTVNVRASNPKVHRWCRSLYVDLGARIKLSLDWRSLPADTRPAEYKWDKEAISQRFDTITRAPAYKEIRPSRADLTMLTPHSSKRPSKRSKREVELVDALNDPDIFVDREV